MFKNRNARHYEKKGVKKNAKWGSGFLLLVLPSFLIFFYKI